MSVFNEPTQWTNSLVNAGDANTIPATTPAGTGKASFESGFPALTQVPLSAGGIAPDRKDFNGLFKLLGEAVFYMQNGGLWTYNAGFDYPVGRIVFYNNNFYKCIQANGASSTLADPTNTAYWVKLLTASDLTSVNQTGDVKLTFNPNIPDGWLLCNGATVSRTDYADLWDFANDNNLVRATDIIADMDTTTDLVFGAGDGSTTFTLPDTDGRSLMGTTDPAQLAHYVPAQLPNIEGSVAHIGSNSLFWQGNSSWVALEGALSASSEVCQASYSSTANISAIRKLILNASNYDSTYADSAEVHSRAATVYALIKA